MYTVAQNSNNTTEFSNGSFMSNAINCFKAYDVRGRIPDELNDDIAYRIGRGYAQVIKPKKSDCWL
jgi:phosphomannomutase